jgi:cobalamin biosynthesis Mg chelatase CobN
MGRRTLPADTGLARNERRIEMRRILKATAVAGAFVLITAAPALAWHITVQGSAICDEASGNYVITWTIGNWNASHPANVTASSTTGGSYSGSVGNSASFQEVVPGTTTSSTLTANATWSGSNETDSKSASVSTGGDCRAPEPEPTPEPTETPTPEPPESPNPQPSESPNPEPTESPPPSTTPPPAETQPVDSEKETEVQSASAGAGPKPGPNVGGQAGGGAAAARGELAFTGSRASVPLLISVMAMLLVVGVALLWLDRRRIAGRPL